MLLFESKFTQNFKKINGYLTIFYNTFFKPLRDVKIGMYIFPILLHLNGWLHLPSPPLFPSPIELPAFFKWTGNGGYFGFTGSGGG